MNENQDKNMFLPFRIDEYRFAVSAMEVESIVEFPEFRSVPLTPESFMGVFLHRNQATSLVSLKRKFGLIDDNNSGYVILTQIASRKIGFHVDEIYKLIAASDTIPTKINWNLSFGCFNDILLNENDMFIQTTFEELFNTEDAKTAPQKNIETKPAIKEGMKNNILQFEPRSKTVKPESKQTGTAKSKQIGTERIPDHKIKTTEIKKTEKSAHVEIPKPRKRVQDKKYNGISAFQKKNEKIKKVADLHTNKKVSYSSLRQQNLKARESANLYADQQSFDHIGTSNKKNKNTPILPILTIIIVIILSVAGFFLFNTKEKESDINISTKKSPVNRKTNISQSNILIKRDKPVDFKKIIVIKEEKKLPVKLGTTVYNNKTATKGNENYEKKKSENLPQKSKDNTSFDSKFGKMVKKPMDKKPMDNKPVGDNINRDDIIEEKSSTGPGSGIQENQRSDEKKEIRAEEKTDVELKSVEVIAETEVAPEIEISEIEQPVSNIPEKIENNELILYTRKKSEDWVKIEQNTPGDSPDMVQLNNIKEQDMKIETREFTLIIDRQKSGETESPVPAYDEIAHSDYQVYIVVPGDTLWHLAERFLGNPFWFMVLAESSMIKNPDLIYPGDKIYIIKKKTKTDD